MRIQAPFVMLILLTAMLSAIHVAYAIARVPPSPGAEILLGYSYTLFLVIWADADARRRLPCFDFGLILLVTFPLGLLWYLWRSRRWGGLLLLAGLVGLAYVPALTAYVAWLLLYAIV